MLGIFPKHEPQSRRRHRCRHRDRSVALPLWRCPFGLKRAVLPPFGRLLSLKGRTPTPLGNSPPSPPCQSRAVARTRGSPPPGQFDPSPISQLARELATAGASRPTKRVSWCRRKVPPPTRPAGGESRENGERRVLMGRATQSILLGRDRKLPRPELPRPEVPSGHSVHSAGTRGSGRASHLDTLA